MKTIKDRLNEEMAKRDWNGSRLAKESGVPQATIQRILAGIVNDMRRESVIKCAVALGMTESELRFGNKDSGGVENNLKRVPLLDWNELDNYKKIAFNTRYALEGEEDRNMVNVTHGHEGCFALKVKCDTMKPEFSLNDIIVVDPNAKAKSGDFVIAVIAGQPTFKQLIVDMRDLFLKPLNPDYPIKPLKLDHYTDIIGVVVEKIKVYT